MLRSISLQRSVWWVMLVFDAWTILSGMKAKVSELFLSTFARLMARLMARWMGWRFGLIKRETYRFRERRLKKKSYPFLGETTRVGKNSAI